MINTFIKEKKLKIIEIFNKRIIEIFNKEIIKIFNKKAFFINNLNEKLKDANKNNINIILFNNKFK